MWNTYPKAPGTAFTHSSRQYSPWERRASGGRGGSKGTPLGQRTTRGTRRKPASPVLVRRTHHPPSPRTTSTLVPSATGSKKAPGERGTRALGGGASGPGKKRATLRPGPSPPKRGLSPSLAALSQFTGFIRSGTQTGSAWRASWGLLKLVASIQ